MLNTGIQISFGLGDEARNMDLQRAEKESGIRREIVDEPAFYQYIYKEAKPTKNQERELTTLPRPASY